MISLSGGLKTTVYYVKASRPCGRFPWWIVRGSVHRDGAELQESWVKK